jgi:hypothetical protein
MGGLHARRPTSLKDIDCSNRRAVISRRACAFCLSQSAAWNPQRAFASRRGEVSSNILKGGVSGWDAVFSANHKRA